MPVFSSLAQLLLLFVYFRSFFPSLFLFLFFQRRIRLFPREHVEFPAKCEAQRGERRGRELSDCRHLRAGLSLINDGNIPPYTVTRPRRPTRDTPTPPVVYKRYCRVASRRCAASLPAFTVSTTATVDKKRATRCRISADLRLSAKSFSTRRARAGIHTRALDRYFGVGGGLRVEFPADKRLLQVAPLISLLPPRVRLVVGQLIHIAWESNIARSRVSNRRFRGGNDRRLSSNRS